MRRCWASSPTGGALRPTAFPQGPQFFGTTMKGATAEGAAGGWRRTLERVTRAEFSREGLTRLPSAL